MGGFMSKKTSATDVEKAVTATKAKTVSKEEKAANKMPAAPVKAKLGEPKRSTNYSDEYYGVSEPGKYQDERGTCDCGAPVPYKGMTCAEQGKTCY